MQNNWKILTIDSDPVANKTIKLLLDDLKFLDKSVLVLKASSIDQARGILKKTPSIMVIFIDFINQGKEAALKFIEYVRDEIDNKKIRILLRTGYPNGLPCKDIMEKYEIDGCFSKDSISKQQIELLTISALRSYNQVMVTEKVLQGLAGSIAHEIRNPLSSIKLASQVVKGILDQQAQRKEGGYFISDEDISLCRDLMLNVQNAVSQGDNVINIILNNIRKGKINPSDFQRLSIAHIVNYAVNTYPYQSEKERESVKVSVDEDFEFYGDEALVTYVLYNLIRNSLYYFRSRKHGLLEIISIFGKEFNVLKVIDNGPGIEPERIPVIFENFMASNKKEGTGLGLPFCKRAMKIMGGDIACGSKLTKGTTFTLTFPILGKKGDF